MAVWLPFVQEEKRRMKEEIERRRAEAAERRQKVGEEVDGEGRKPFVCMSPRGSSLKVSPQSARLSQGLSFSSLSQRYNYTSKRKLLG